MRRFFASIRELGLFGTFCYRFDRALSAAFGDGVHLHHLFFVSQPLPARDILPPGRGRSIEVRRLQIDAAVEVGVPIEQAHYIEERRRSGATCLAAFKDGELLGYRWLNRHAHDDEMVFCRFVPDPEGNAIWGIEFRVKPEHRGGLVFARLWDESYALMRAEGMTHWASYIVGYKAEVRSAEKRMGGHTVGSAIVLMIGPAQLYLGTLAPYADLSFRRAGRPTVRVPAAAGS